MIPKFQLCNTAIPRPKRSDGSDLIPRPDGPDRSNCRPRPDEPDRSETSPELPNTLYPTNPILCCEYNIVLSQRLSFCGGNLPIAHLLVHVLTGASQMSDRAINTRSSRLRNLFAKVLSGKQGITDVNTSLFLEAICDQSDPATCIQRLISSGHGFLALQSALRINTSSTFLNGPLPSFL